MLYIHILLYIQQRLFGFYTTPIDQIKVEIRRITCKDTLQMQRAKSDTISEDESEFIKILVQNVKTEVVPATELTGPHTIFTPLKEDEFMIISACEQDGKIPGFLGHENLYLTWHHQSACHSAVFRSVAFLMMEHKKTINSPPLHDELLKQIDAQIDADMKTMKYPYPVKKLRSLRQWLPHSHPKSAFLRQSVNGIVSTVMRGTPGIGK